MVDEVKTQIRGLGLDMAEKMGQISEHVPNDEQMEAFNGMNATPEDWVRLSEEKGPKKADEFMREMLRREALSQSKQRPT